MNKYEQRSKTFYDKTAKGFDRTFEGKFTLKYKNMLCQVVKINTDDAVVDVACGTGSLLNKLKEKKSFQGFGVDISEKMIEQAKTLNPEMRFAVASCDNLPFENGQIDVMTVCAAYHHFPYVHKFAKEAGRVIKKDGWIYIAEIYLPALLRTICNPFVKLSKAGDVKFYAPKEIISLFEQNGFTAKEKKIKGDVQVIGMQKI